MSLEKEAAALITRLSHPACARDTAESCASVTHTTHHTTIIELLETNKIMVLYSFREREPIKGGTV